ncbi:methyltransferase domain-containing protein [Thiomicrospira microaerophila]|uniref:methyltransferase domain-containing protein n=1 Tax=Thiomicrospira microaerophila TaxID=406020 RepID=UPI00200E3C0A|nr:methyltransferase domain-containing protein [Thiomicrospira microaerophila]UQB42181.1 methyltransferase domain-containing protein [Thiomicrospira microaerophila]
MKTKQDRNFDRLVDKFAEKVYGTLKGEWRLKLLKEDLQRFHVKQPGLVVAPLDIWDAGCGFGQISQWLAESGHQLTLSDLSKNMLYHAQQNFEQAKLNANFIQGPAQDLAKDLPVFDLVLFHAVLEWLAQPKQTLETLVQKVKPGGYLSLLFYNRNAIVYTNMLKGEWRWRMILDDAYIGTGKKLTPPNPHYPHEVQAWLTDWGFDVQEHTGIRVFHDYLRPEVIEKSDLDELMALEYQYCRTPTYRDMGRYIHLLAQRKAK